MLSNRLAFAALGLVCVAAAAGGSYVATRHNATEHLVVADTPSTLAERTALTTDAPASQATPAARLTEAPETQAAPANRPTTAVIEREPAAAEPTRSTSTARAPKVVASAPRPAASSKPASRTAQRVEPTVVREEPSVAQAPAASAPAAETPGTAPRTEERAAAESQPTPAAPATASFDEVVVASDSVIGLRTETALSSERARVEDRVEARVVRDVRVGGRVAIPAGTRALGSVVVVERGGRLKERARLGIRFHTLAMADGTRLPISTETIYRYGDAPGDASSKKIGGGAVAGAILGAIIGGGKGAAIGAATGAAGGGAVVMTGDRSEATFPSGGEVTARIVSPVTVTIER